MSFLYNSKKKLFYLSNISLIILVLSINNYIIEYFSKYNSYSFIILVIIGCTMLYHILSATLINDIFKTDKKLEEKIEKTMHEINTPVATIQLNTEILETKLTKKENLERLTRINKSCDNLLKLYEDMEYFIKKEIDNIETIEFNLKESVEICIEKFDDLKKNIQIVTNVDTLMIKTDKSGFETMLTNLISNSIKHNKKITTINIEVKNNILIFQDNGEGISTQNLYKVFDRYFQPDETKKGFGIGLNMVKEFCDENKLDIKINSSSLGTVFNINLSNIIKKS